MVSKEKVFLGLSIRFVNNFFVSKLRTKRLKTLYDSLNSSFDEFRAERNFLIGQDPVSPTGSGFQISFPRTKSELIENYKLNKTSLVFSLEGAHNLHGSLISEHHKLTDKRPKRKFDNDEISQYLGNIDSIKNMPQRVLFVTLGHFAWNGVVGSAKSLDMGKFRFLLLSKSRFERFRRKVFYKPGDGIIGDVYDLPPKSNSSSSKSEKESLKEVKKQEKGMKRPDICECKRIPVRTQDLGWQTIRKLLDTANGKAPIYIDVKHMDIRARFQYYQYLDTSKYKNIPIIASHIAASGEDSALATYTGLCPVYDVYQEVSNTRNWYNYQERLKCVPISKERKDTVDWFYPWSINLCNEEIKRIYDSDGIIGIALEERVIGTGRPNYKAEKDDDIKFIMAKGFSKTEAETFYDMQPFFHNMFYFVQHSNRSDPTAWDHLALGSDFDGIAKPVKFCRSAAEIPKLHALLIKFLPYYIELKDVSKLTFGLDAKTIADKIVFENGEKFILKYF